MMKITNILIIYLIIINIIAFIIFGIDKYAAVKHKYRIKESTLFAISLIGGAIGGIIGMQVFRHKTLKPIFKYGLPTVLVFQIIIYIIIKNI